VEAGGGFVVSGLFSTSRVLKGWYSEQTLKCLVIRPDFSASN
jgi:hypothetical protein